MPWMSSGTDVAMAAPSSRGDSAQPVEQRGGELRRTGIVDVAAREIVGGEQHAVAPEARVLVRVCVKLDRRGPPAISTAKASATSIAISTVRSRLRGVRAAVVRSDCCSAAARELQRRDQAEDQTAGRSE